MALLVPEPKPQHDYYGQFAIMSRLISTLVSEDMVSAYFIPAIDDELNALRNSPYGRTVMGFCFLTNLDQPASGFNEESFYVFAALRGTPELYPNQFISLNEFYYQKIDLLHPWDVLPYIYGPSDNVIPFDFADAPNLDCSFLHGGQYMRNKAVRQLRSLGLDNGSILGLRDGYDPIRLWRRCAYDFNLTAKATDMCASWLNNSSKIQTHIYNNPNPLPTFQSPSIHWEHSIMEGHPLFPISRTVRAISPLPEMTPSDFMKLFGNTRVRLAAIPHTHVELNGDFEQATRILVDRILNMNGNAQETRAEFADHVLVPVHQYQVPNIQEKMPNVHIFPEENHVIAYGLSSGRTLAVPGIVDGQTIKLSLGIELASIMRSILPASARYGYRFSTEVVPHMSYNPNVLTIQTEPTSACYLDSNPEIAKHLCCIVRNSEEIRTTATNHRFAVCAALVEKIRRPDTSQTLVTHAWKLDTQEKRIKFLNEYIRLFFNAIIPPCRDNGIAFECHAQNTILRFDPEDHGAPRGFLIRDLCDMQVHPETLVRTIGRDVRDLFPEGGYNCAKSLEQVYIFLYYGAIYIHLQTLIRVLGLHDNGIGWALAREHFAALVDRDHPMYDFFLRRERVPIRSYTRTRLLSTCVSSAFFGNILKPNLFLIGLPDDQRSSVGSDGSDSSPSWAAALGSPVSEEPTRQANNEHMGTRSRKHQVFADWAAATSVPSMSLAPREQLSSSQTASGQASNSGNISEQPSNSQASKSTKKKAPGSKVQRSNKARKISKQATAPQATRAQVKASSSRTTAATPSRQSSQPLFEKGTRLATSS